MDKKLSPWWVAFLWAMVFGLAAAAAVAIVMVNSIRRSTSSTAAVGCVFIPFFAAPFALASGIWGLSIYGTWVAIRNRVHPALAVASGLVALGVPLAAGVHLVQGFQFQSEVNAAHRMNAEELQAAFESSPWRKNRFFLGAIAGNAETSSDLLDRIASLPDPEL